MIFKQFTENKRNIYKHISLIEKQINDRDLRMITLQYIHLLHYRTLKQEQKSIWNLLTDTQDWEELTSLIRRLT